MILAALVVTGIAATAPVEAQEINWPQLQTAANCDRQDDEFYRNYRGPQNEREYGCQKELYYKNKYQSKNYNERGRNIEVIRPRVTVNGRELTNSAPAIQVAGHTFVPMRAIFEALGAQANYDNRNRTATATRGGRSIELPLPGNRNVRYGQSLQALAQRNEPFGRDGVTMVPLRLVSEKMGAKVSYTASSSTPQISITD